MIVDVLMEFEKNTQDSVLSKSLSSTLELHLTAVEMNCLTCSMIGILTSGSKEIEGVLVGSRLSL